MVKKIVLITLFVGLVGVLVAGGINRTIAKTSDGNETHGQDAGAVESDTGHNGNGSQDSSGGGGGNQGATNGSGRAAVDAWLEFAGTAVAVDNEALEVELESGEELSVTGRPWRFALENGFAAAPGDALVLTGFYDGDLFEVGAIANQSTGQEIQIRDENGRPLWAGGGQRNG